MAEVVVADAGPLIALARVIDLALLPEVFARALVTETVLSECLVRDDRPEGAVISAAIGNGWLIRLPDPPLDTDWGLGPGEASAIAAARARGAGLLMDDRAGRRIARELGIPTIGALGVLLLGKRRGRLTEIRPRVERLLASGYFLGGAVVDDALTLAGEPPLSDPG